MVEAVVMSRKSYNSGGFNAAGDRLMVTGLNTITSGSQTNIDTGLSSIDQVFLSIKDSGQTAGAGAYCTYDHGADGLLDIYIWDDAGAAAANSTVVAWMAIGSK